MTALTQSIPNPAVVIGTLAVVAAAGPVALLVALWDRGWLSLRRRRRSR